MLVEKQEESAWDGRKLRPLGCHCEKGRVGRGEESQPVST